MKILCEKCNQNISVKVDSLFESYSVGKIQCDKCKKLSNRYISEADILLYYGLSEVIYVVISLVTKAFMNSTGFTWWMMGVIVLVLIAYFFLQKQLSRLIYVNAYFKKDFKDYDFKQDPESISKNMKWQFMLFFAIAITYMLEDTAKLFFGVMLILSVLLTFIKFYLALKNEKNIVLNDPNYHKKK